MNLGVMEIKIRASGLHFSTLETQLSLKWFTRHKKTKMSEQRKQHGAFSLRQLSGTGELMRLNVVQM